MSKGYGLASVLVLSSVGFFASASSERAATGAQPSPAPVHAISLRDGAHRADNPENGFRARFGERGVELESTGEDLPAWKWGLSWTAWGRGDVSWAVPPASLAADRTRIDLARGNLVEWYENGPRGLEQGFVLPEPPERWAERTGAAPIAAGAKPAGSWVHLDLALEGSLFPIPADDGRSIRFAGAGVLSGILYSDLAVFDARGTEIPSRMEMVPGEGGRAVRLSFDASEAVFPVTVDPLSSSAQVVLHGQTLQSLAQFGSAVALAGDVNGDGYSDMVVGEYLYDGGQTDEGRVLVFGGGPSGPSTPSWNIESNQAGSRFGSSVATAGDVNGDGYADIIAGAPYYDNGQTNEGRAFVFLGSESGIGQTPSWVAESDQAGSLFGTSVATAGDVNGDGYSDVIVGAPNYNNGQANEGRVYVYLGSASGLSTTPAFVLDSGAAGAHYGQSVASAGDVNGDGFSDIVVGAPDYGGSGRMELFLGGQSGLSSGAAIPGGQAGCELGYAVGPAGDVNGDGYADVIVTAPFYDNQGRAYVYFGHPAAPVLTLGWNKAVGHGDAYFGWSAGTAGDVDGDGYADVIVGEPFYYTSPTEGGGRAYLFRGGPAGLSQTESWMAELAEANAAFGWSVATAGDVDGNGVSDVVVGSPWEDDGVTNSGRARVYYGTPAYGLTLQLVEWTQYGNQDGAHYGAAVASNGDVNGDGHADILVGAPDYTGSLTDEGRVFLYHGAQSQGFGVPDWTADGAQAAAHLGSSVAFAGDVNGDGFDDLIVGAPDHDATGVDSGRVTLYLGSASGVSDSPAWMFDGEQAGARFGASVSAAGDVNGDGYADVVVGSPGFDGVEVDEGKAYLFLGSAAGLMAAPAWTTEGDQAGAELGNAVAAAGDVNGDGFDDVAVAAWLYDGPAQDSGRVSVFHGSPSGLAPTPSWTAAGENWPGARYGASVDSAGDPTADGYSDLIVGSPGADDGRGHFSIVLGSAAGLSTEFVNAESDQIPSGNGFHVVGIGNTSGHGFTDFAASTEGGWVGLYLGCPQSWCLQSLYLYDHSEGFGPTDGFGAALGGAGDVNGDGAADLVVGAPLRTLNHPEEGAIHLFEFVVPTLGGRDLVTRIRQRSSDDQRPISFGGASEAEDAFEVLADARTPYGRANGQLEIEVKPLGIPFDGLATQIEAPQDLGTTGVTLAALVSGQSPGAPLHWRVRLRPDPVTAPFAPPRSRWVEIPNAGSNQRMLRTAGVAVTTQAETLTMTKDSMTGELQLSWESSCDPGDSDYAIYEGALGDFTSHVPLACATGGLTSWTITPSAGDRYYLVVPDNGVFERSYGQTSSGMQRLPSAAACLPQNLGVCP